MQWSGSPTQQVMGAVNAAREMGQVNEDIMERVLSRLKAAGVTNVSVRGVFLADEEAVKNVTYSSMSCCGLLPCFWPQLCTAAEREKQRLYFVTQEGCGSIVREHEGCCCCGGGGEEADDFRYHTWDRVEAVEEEEKGSLCFATETMRVVYKTKGKGKGKGGAAVEEETWLVHNPVSTASFVRGIWKDNRPKKPVTEPDHLPAAEEAA